MFWLMLPIVGFVALYLNVRIEGPDYGSPCCIVLLGPMAAISAVAAVLEARRPGGRRALLFGLMWAGIAVAGWCAFAWVVTRFHWMKGINKPG
jgi:hypothetical protein